MAITADEERQMAMEIAVDRFFKTYFEEISFASSPSDKFHRFYILKAVLEDLASAGYQIGKIGEFSLDLSTSVAVKDAKMLSQRAGQRLLEYIYGEIVAFEEGEKDVIRGHRASDGPGPLFLEGELPDMKAVERANPDIFRPIFVESGTWRASEVPKKLFATINIDGEVIKNAVEEHLLAMDMLSEA